MTSRFTILNDRLCEDVKPLVGEAYVVQSIHVCRLKPQNLAAHITVAAGAAKRLFGVEYKPDVNDIDALCRRMLVANHYPEDVSSQIVMKIVPSGDVRYECGEVLVHNGIVVRAIRPDATCLVYDVPFGDEPTSAREAAHVLALAKARKRGFRSVVRVTSQGLLADIDSSPLFMVKDDVIHTPIVRNSVERESVIRLAHAAGVEVVERDIRREELQNADELFCFDYRGLTALGSCDGKHYMDLIVRRIARRLKR